ncbi:MAG: hypothetical protein H6719_08415 [Sandaracinaceae bacterium]|nr:hypothetical protein [Sandaracinaceae bacterium]
METLESVAFLALCTLIPTLMIGVLVYRLVRWAFLRSGWNRTLEERGWAGDVDEAILRLAIEDVGLPVGRAHLSWMARADGAFAAFYRHRPPGRQNGTARRILLVAREETGPRGVLQPRVGGLLESAALGVAKALSVEPREIDGWEWALVMPQTDDWLEPGASPPLRDLLQDGERLHFGDRYVALSLPEGEMPPLLDRLEPLRAALGGER